MDPENQLLRLYDIGAYGVLTKRQNPDRLVVVTYPLFELILPLLERRAGHKFTQDEVDTELAQAPSVALSKEEAGRYTAAQRRGQRSR